MIEDLLEEGGDKGKKCESLCYERRGSDVDSVMESVIDDDDIFEYIFNFL